MPVPDPPHAALRADVSASLASGTSVEVVGMLGSGRSTFLASVAGELDHVGWQVLRVRGVAALRSRPLEALATAGLLGHAEKRPVSPIAGAVARLEQLVGAERSVLVVDDADDLDEASVGVIAAAHARRAFAVLLSSRPRRRGGDEILLGESISPVTRLLLPSLDYAEMHDLLRQVLPGDFESRLVGRLYTLSGGLPGPLVRLVETGRRRGAIRSVDGLWEAGPDLWSSELVPVAAALARDLSPAAGVALENLAFTDAIDLVTVRRIIDDEALTELDASGLLRRVVRGGDVGIGVFPPLVAEWVRRTRPWAGLAVDERLRAVLDTGEPAVEMPKVPGLPWNPISRAVVNPFAIVDEPTDEAGIVVNRRLLAQWYRMTLLRQAAWEASPVPQTAVPYLQALVVVGAEPPVIHDVVDRTADSGDPVWQARWVSWQANVHAEVDHDVDQAINLLTAAAEESDDTGRAWLLADARRLETLHGTVPGPRPSAWTPAPVRLATDLVEVQRLITIGEPAAALALLPDADDGIGPGFGWRSVLRGVALLVAGRIDEAARHASAEIDRAQAELDIEAYHGHAYVVSVTLLLQARASELWSHLGRTLSLALRSAHHRHFEAGNLSVAAVMAAVDGRSSTARSLLEQAGAVRVGPGPFPFMGTGWARAVADVRSDGDEARARASEGAWAEATDLLDRGHLVAGATSGLLAQDLAYDTSHADTLATATRHVSAGFVQHVLLAQSSARLAPDGAIQVARDLVSAGQVFIGLRVLTRLAGRLQQAGDVVGSRAVLAVGRELALPHGTDAARMVRPVSSSMRLTHREHEIATLVVTGLSNAEIAAQLHLSARTVQNHINHVFAKLGVSGRGALTRELLA